MMASDTPGEVAERLNAPVSKTGIRYSTDRGFESLPLRNQVLERWGSLQKIDRGFAPPQAENPWNPPVGGSLSADVSGVQFAQLEGWGLLHRLYRQLAAEHAFGKVTKEIFAPSANGFSTTMRSLRNFRRRIIRPPVGKIRCRTLRHIG